jgi:hypothetical protein
VTGLCFEGLPHFLDGVSNCKIRNYLNANTGFESCLEPGPEESSLTECVNTVQNDTVRSDPDDVRTHNSIVETRPPAGTSPNASWIDGLVRDLRINLTTGTSGSGSERGFGSVIQLLSDNEGTETKFFRPNSLRILIFVSDEDDQSLQIPKEVPDGFNPWTDYRGRINGEADGTGCAQKVVGDHHYTLTSCPDASKLITPGEMKGSLNAFFNKLDNYATGDPNYFVVSIVTEKASTIQTLQAQRDEVDEELGFSQSVSVNRGDRYIELAEVVGNDSFVMDIGAENYDALLEHLGETMVRKRLVFRLNHPPTSKDDMKIILKNANGVSQEIKRSLYEIEGTYIVFTDLQFMLDLTPSDRIVVDYQPKKTGN